MTNPHLTSPPARGYGHKMFYPNGPSSLSPTTASFSADTPPPLCDFPKYVDMALLRNAVNTRQKYASSPALIMALEAYYYKLPVYKNAVPSIPKVRTFTTATPLCHFSYGEMSDPDDGHLFITNVTAAVASGRCLNGTFI